MKKTLALLVCLLVLPCIYSFLTYRDITESYNTENTILVQLSAGVLSEETFNHHIQEIEDKSFREFLKKFKVSGLRSVFKNRYNKEGFLKEEVASSGKELLEGWYELCLNENLIPRNSFHCLANRMGSSIH